MAEKFSFGEGAFLNKPPMFCGTNYELWCIRMKFFVESIDRKIWNVITNSYRMPTSENVSSEREHLDCVAMNIIVSALDPNELLKVSKCNSAKEMWNTLEEYHKNPMSVLMDKEESNAESFSSKSRKEVCLIIKEESGSNQVSASSSNNSENYFQLLNVFQKTHEKAKRLAFLNNRLKSENNKLKEKIIVLENDLSNTNVDFENLELIYKNFSCNCDSSCCKNCKTLQEKVVYPVKTIDIISKGKSNFENVLASQQCVFGKSGLGFNPQSKNFTFSESFSNLTKNQLVKSTKQPVVCCLYCMKKGPSVRFCKIIKVYVPKGILKWVPKILKDPNDLTNTHGPKFVRGPILPLDLVFFFFRVL